MHYRELNNVTTMNLYLLTLMNELHDWVLGAKIITKFDLEAGYNLIGIKMGEELKTSFH